MRATRWLGAGGAALVALSASGCYLLGFGYSYDINYETYTLPARATLFAEVCTPQDDYNIAPPPSLRASFPLVFSSNRGGASFDLVGYDVDARLDQVSGQFSLSADPLRDPVLAHRLARINSAADELGPSYAGDDSSRGTFLFASDRDGAGLDVFRLDGVDVAPRRVEALCSDADDAYPCVRTAEGAVYFDSNRGGRYAIHRLTPAVLAGAAADGEVSVVEDLAGEGDARCPFVLGDRMVFTSNRPGGQGGWDLYLSRFVDGAWSTPVNLGPGINSPQDEYRPVIVAAPEFENDLLLFSSNRPGGPGGFDLYWAGIAR